MNLSKAVTKWTVDKVREGLYVGTDVNIKDSDGQTAALSLAERARIKKEVGLWLKTDLNSRDITGWTPLLLAVKLGWNEMVKLLLKTDGNTECDANTKDFQGKTPLHNAISSRDCLSMGNRYEIRYESILPSLNNLSTPTSQCPLLLSDSGEIRLHNPQPNNPLHTSKRGNQVCTSQERLEVVKY